MKFFIVFVSIVITCAVLYIISDAIGPFMFAICIAYALNPFKIWLSNIMQLKRAWLASLYVATIFFGSIIMLLCVIGPMIYEQLYNLIMQITDNQAIITRKLLDVLSIFDNFAPQIKNQLLEQIKSLSSQLINGAVMVLKGIVQSGFFAANTLSFIIITPLVTFYLLKDSDIIVSVLYSIIPSRYISSAKKISKDMALVMVGFFRGQLLVCMCLAFYYIAVFYLMNLNSWLGLGVVSGILIFIPYLGSFLSTLLCLLIAMSQFGIDYHLIMISIFLLCGQFIEGIFLTPKFIGDNVKLHPIWVIFSLTVGFHLAGFWGVLISVPLAAIFGVIIRFCLIKYHNSEFYKFDR